MFSKCFPFQVPVYLGKGMMFYVIFAVQVAHVPKPVSDAIRGLKSCIFRVATVMLAATVYHERYGEPKLERNRSEK